MNWYYQKSQRRNADIAGKPVGQPVFVRVGIAGVRLRTDQTALNLLTPFEEAVDAIWNRRSIRIEA